MIDRPPLWHTPALPGTLPTGAALSSLGRGWTGIAAELLRDVPPTTVRVAGAAQHRVDLRFQASGRLECAWGGAEYRGPSRPGDIAVIPAAADVAWAAEAPAGEVLHLHLAPALLAQAFDDRGLDAGTPLAARCRFVDQGLLALGRMLRGELLTGTGGRLFAESAGMMVAGLLVRGQAGLGANRPGGLPAWRLKRVCDHVEAHLADDLGLDGLAAQAGLSPDRFAHAFKAATGRAPHRYVIERRVQRAAELLATTREPIAAIALAVGCSSQAHLTTLFRQVLGTTPGAYRRGS